MVLGCRGTILMIELDSLGQDFAAGMVKAWQGFIPSLNFQQQISFVCWS